MRAPRLLRATMLTTVLATVPPTTLAAGLTMALGGLVGCSGSNSETPPPLEPDPGRPPAAASASATAR